jgi:hypothetical protein
MKKFLNKFAFMALFATFGMALTASAATPTWNTSGNYGITFNYQSTDYAHIMSVTQDGLGNITGNGSYPTSPYTWVINSGSTVVGNSIDFTANYTASADAVTPQTTMHVVGTIANDGTMSGTWSDNYQGGTRTGTWRTVSGAATAVTSSTVVVNSNTAPWYFNADPANTTPYTFNTAASSIGSGSLYVLPIGTTPADKFTADNIINTPVANINSLSYDFKIGATGNPSQANQFYMNVYANFGVSSPTKYYDCRYDVVATTGSTGSFTTVTFDPSQAYLVTTRGGSSASPFTCPAKPADMNILSPGSVVRGFTINVGDTSASDAGVSGYLDRVVVSTVSNTTTYNFEPAPTSSNVHIYKYIDGVQATAVNAGSVSFPMFTSTYNAPFTLSPTGWTTGDIAYEASTGAKSLGFSYTMNENTSTSLVGTSCDGTHQYMLAGYQMSSVSLADAAAKPVTLTAPSFTNLNGDGYIIVRNTKCIDVTAPALPVHLSPANRSHTTTAALTMVDWTDVADPSGPVKYYYEVSHYKAIKADGSFTKPIYQSAALSASNIPTPNTQVGRYFWHVRAVDAAGNSTAWTSAWKFNVENRRHPRVAEECKGNNWKTYSDMDFRTQAACVNFVNDTDNDD